MAKKRVQKKDRKWVIIGLIIFILVMIIYFKLKPEILASPGDSSVQLSQYFNQHTLFVAISVLLGSLTLAFILEKVRKKIDNYLIPKKVREKQLKEQEKQKKKIANLKASQD